MAEEGEAVGGGEPVERDHLDEDGGGEGEVGGDEEAEAGGGGDEGGRVGHGGRHHQRGQPRPQQAPAIGLRHVHPRPVSEPAHRDHSKSIGDTDD